MKKKIVLFSTLVLAAVGSILLGNNKKAQAVAPNYYLHECNEYTSCDIGITRCWQTASNGMLCASPGWNHCSNC